MSRWKVLFGVAVSCGAVACTGSEVGDDDFSPVPTSPTPTPTPSPIPTAPLTPFTAPTGWRAGAAGELWFKVTVGFSGAITAVRGYDPGAAGCDVFITLATPESVVAGKTSTFMLDDTGICTSGAHDFRVDYTAAGVPGLQSAVFAAVPTLNALDAGEAALLGTTVSAHLGTTRKLRFKITPTTSLEISQVRLYQPTTANTPTATCDQTAPYLLVGGAVNLFDACDVTPGVDTVTGYQAVFRGKDLAGGDSYYGMVTFTFSSNGSLSPAGNGTWTIDPSLADFDGTP